MHVEVNATTAPEMTVLAMDSNSRVAIPRGKSIHVLKTAHHGTAENARNVFVMVLATELPGVAEFVSQANRRHQLRALFVRDDSNAYWIPQLFERAGLRTLRNTLVHSGLSVPGRVLRAWAHGAQEDLIADATIAGNRLFVTSCALRQYEVPIAKVPPLKSLPKAVLANFRIDEDGSYLHWPEPDIHLDLDAIRIAIDPAAKRKALVSNARWQQQYGKAITKLRLEKGVKQSDVPGLSERQVRRIEHGEGTTYESLSRLATAHGMALDEYLNRLAEIAAGA
ncbi:MAG: DUF2442 domain-containing protein [Terriglobales bacterium]|jgi:hypothetical protein